MGCTGGHEHDPLYSPRNLEEEAALFVYINNKQITNTDYLQNSRANRGR